MMPCPHCEHPVDETVNTICPICRKPMKIEPEAAEATQQVRPDGLRPVSISTGQPSQPAAEAAPAAATSAAAAGPLYGASAPLSGGTPVYDLNGNVIEDSKTAPSYAGGQRAGGYSTMPGAYTPAPGSAAAKAAARPASRSRSQGGGGLAAVALITLLVLGAGGFGGWYWYSHRSTPEKSAQTFVTALGNQDWATVYTVTDMPAAAVKKYPDAQSFAAGMNKNMNKAKSSPIGSFLTMAFTAFKTAKVGTAVTTGDTASVPVTYSISLMGQSITNTLNLKLQDVSGVWKVQANKGMMPAGGMGGGGGFMQGAGFGR